MADYDKVTDVQSIARQMCRDDGNDPNEIIGYHSYGRRRKVMRKWMEYEPAAWECVDG